MTSKKILIALVTSGVLAGGAVALELSVGAAEVSAATYQTVIDASKDPAAANAALNQFCNPGPNGVNPKVQKLGDCDYAGNISTVGLGAPKVMGDAVYNCYKPPSADTQNGYAEDSVEISDERSSSLTHEESLEATVTLGVVELGVAFDTSGFSEVATKLSVAQEVSIAPGNKGWITSRSPEALDDAIITNPGQSLEVKNFSFTLPGYGNDTYKDLLLTSVHDSIDYTNKVDAQACQGLNLRLPNGARGAGPESGVRILICPSTPVAAPQRRAAGRGRGRRARRCATRFVSAPKQTIRIRARMGVALTRGTREYASGIAGKKRIVLHAQRRVRPGRYLLVLSGPRHSTIRHVTVD